MDSKLVYLVADLKEKETIALVKELINEGAVRRKFSTLLGRPWSRGKTL